MSRHAALLACITPTALYLGIKMIMDGQGQDQKPARGPGGRWPSVGVMIRIKAGMDPSYPWKQMGTSERQVFTGELGAGYYLSAVQKGGEPAGTWVGEGLADLGIHDG